MTVANDTNDESIGTDVRAPSAYTAGPDQAHLGDIHSALGMKIFKSRNVAARPLGAAGLRSSFSGWRAQLCAVPRRFIAAASHQAGSYGRRSRSRGFLNSRAVALGRRTSSGQEVTGKEVINGGID
ncbi:hypothetical protein JQ554_06810 [Bradyrhizobium diazoefficiens]|jgi:hypothetical protein|nr:hypothetical protein [Bradyrhizobium diazoefficiens]MBR0963806.1 hypothetical protein [Bradyrhizobium diazoefficiens]MBR0977957.1 hypothetical protein [Bradyrhizobium diazoefficiens]MBR1007467.1 hypothetical protein [Bradyrhizobium diazoefficiens]MBR1012691.1 hypothetical protein [Bradyrhizobium diazoefficiens]MBR1051554.1 hypothetical protein [Bradyrhizobium diazoefficiens]